MRSRKPVNYLFVQGLSLRKAEAGWAELTSSINSKPLIAPHGVIPEMPQALSGIVADASTRYDPG
jgi:hypothetical protein